jgi:hypothetical protein
MLRNYNRQLKQSVEADQQLASAGCDPDYEIIKTLISAVQKIVVRDLIEYS